jgi:hypothetical protein
MKTATMMCQGCGQAPATYVASASGQPLSFTMAEGKMGQVVRFLCGLCAKDLPDTAKKPIDE